jgi:hypothetical protein
MPNVVAPTAVLFRLISYDCHAAERMALALATPKFLQTAP